MTVRGVQLRRLLMLALLMVAAFCGLGYRLAQLQVVRHSELSVRARQNTQREFVFEPRRGDILDRRGNLLATTVTVKLVCADPSLIGPHSAEVARAIAPLLQLDPVDLERRLTPRTFTNDKGKVVTNQYVRLKSKVPIETWEQVRAAMTNLVLGVDESNLSSSRRAFYSNLRHRAIFAEDTPMRAYPNQSLAAHVLGFATVEERELDGHVIHEIRGRYGVEQTLNSKLRGVPGWRFTQTDESGREIISLREQDVKAREGLNVVLTIDSVIQHTLESALAEVMEKHDPISAAGIVLRPATGEVLAMATLPSFDPNYPGRSPQDALRNRVIADVMEPGSTFKIVVVSGALNDGIVRLGDIFDCERGRFAFGGRILHDHEAYSLLSVKSIITKSSNIGAAKIGIRMGIDRLHEYLQAFGFGERTGIPLPGEVRGIVDPKSWSKVSIAQIPMGHGVAVTRLQMAMAMSAIANGGVLMRPMLVDRLEDQQGRVVARYSPQAMRRVVSESAARQMVEALKTVVTPEGTASRAALEHYTVAGKTGTAQKVENGTYVRKYISSFIGFFPADEPELCIAIVLDEPREGYYGGLVAAPVFKNVAQRAASYLSIRPDIETAVVTNGVLRAELRAGRPVVAE